MSDPLTVGNWVVLNRKAGQREHEIGIVVSEADQFGYVSVDLGGDQPKSFARECLLKLAPGRLWCGYELEDLDNTLRPIVAVRALERLRQKYACTSVNVIADGYQLNCTDHEGEETFTRSRDTLWEAAMDAEQGRWMG